MFGLKKIYEDWKEASAALEELDSAKYPGTTSLITDEIVRLKKAVDEITKGEIPSLKILEKIINAWENNQCYMTKEDGKTRVIFTDTIAAKDFLNAYAAEGLNALNTNDNNEFKFYLEVNNDNKAKTKEEEKTEDEGIVTYSYELDLDEFYDIKSKEEGYPYAEAAFNEVFPEDIREYVREEWEMRWNLADGKNFLISNILSNPDVYTCLKGKVKKQQELINIISSWWDSLLLFVEGFLEGCDDDNAEALNKMVHAFVEDPVTEDGKIKEEKLDEVIDVIFDLFISKNQDSEFKMFLSQPEIKTEFCKLVRDLSLKMEAGASYEDVMAEALPSVVALMMKKVEA
ncbi:MAG: hypothetical protein IKT40_08180 [Bacilli bacterium]|nr:hypothetical protein [Bacilli bacterium]